MVIINACLITMYMYNLLKKNFLAEYSQLMKSLLTHVHKLTNVSKKCPQQCAILFIPLQDF